MLLSSSLDPRSFDLLLFYSILLSSCYCLPVFSSLGSPRSLRSLFSPPTDPRNFTSGYPGPLPFNSSFTASNAECDRHASAIMKGLFSKGSRSNGVSNTAASGSRVRPFRLGPRLTETRAGCHRPLDHRRARQERPGPADLPAGEAAAGYGLDPRRWQRQVLWHGKRESSPESHRNQADGRSPRSSTETHATAIRSYNVSITPFPFAKP